MKVVYLSPTTDFNELELNTFEAKHQNNYSVIHSFKDKLELVTSEPVGDYHVFHSENKGKVFLCVKSPQLNAALHAICERLAKEQGYVFREEKEVYYIRMDPEQAAQVPKYQQLIISVNLYGVFYQTSSKNSFLQMELTGFKSYSLVHFQ